MRLTLGLGSNKKYNGMSCVQILDEAVRKISTFVTNLEMSSIYRTQAMYVTDQDDFYNMVVCGDYSGSCFQLLDDIHNVESSLGRDRSKEFRNGPRSLDVDIELFGNERVNTENLVVPHERMTERAFVLKPLLEILHKNADKFKAEISFYEEKLSHLSDQRIDMLS